MMVIIIGMVGMVVILMRVPGQDLHEFRWHALRAEFEPQTGTCCGRHVAGWNGRAQEQCCAQEQHWLQVIVPESVHQGLLIYQSNPDSPWVLVLIPVALI